MKKYFILITLLVFLMGFNHSKEEKFPGIENFKNPPKNFYPKPLWFWNNTTVTVEVVAKQMQDFHDNCGYGGFGILPFGENFKPAYLSEEYFEVYGAALKKADELGVQLSLYDEYGFPSGTMGGTGTGDGVGRFDENFPEQTIKRLDKTEEIVSGPKRLNSEIPEGKLMAVIAMEKTTLERINLEDKIEDGRLIWNVPKGNWRVMFFVSVKDGYPCVDYLDPEAVRNFIHLTHEEYYKRFSEYFGTVITTSFFDEPWLGRARGRIWTDKFNEKFERKYGFSPEIYYPALWYDIGQETYSARNYLFGFRTELFAKGYAKEVNDWSIAHGIKGTGHWGREEGFNPVSVTGDLMKSFKFLEIPGVDKIGGNRPAERFYKIISSSAYNWDKNLIMSETYGAMPNYDELGDLTWNQIFSIAMDQYAKGINMLIPHAVWYDINNVKYKPELSHRNPLYADSLEIFNQFLARLNLILQKKGKHVADIAVLYPIHTLQGDFRFNVAFLMEPEQRFYQRRDSYYKEAAIPDDDQTDYKIDYVDVANWLTEEACKDFTFLHPEILDEKCRINDGKLIMENAVNQEKFKVLFIPSCKTISLSNLQKIKDFYNEGGHLIFTSQLPSFSVEPGKDEEVREIIDSIISTDELSGSSSKGGKAYFISEPDGKKIRKVLEELNYDYDVDYQANNNLRYIHRVIEGRDVFYFANTGSLAIETIIHLRGKHDFEIWDPHSGEVEEIVTKVENRDGIYQTKLDLKIEPYYSLFLISEN